MGVEHPFLASELIREGQFCAIKTPATLKFEWARARLANGAQLRKSAF